MTTVNNRTTDYQIHPVFLERWSPRAFTGEAITEADLLTMLDAARWAASSHNSQPWVFLYALRDGPDWDRFLGLLNPFNQSWANRASALVVLVSKSFMRLPGADEDCPSYSHSLDAGAASAHFALQATFMGWHVHGMVGVDLPRTFAELNVPEGYRVEAIYAVGRQGERSNLPPKLQEREAPGSRKPLCQIAIRGGFERMV